MSEGYDTQEELFGAPDEVRGSRRNGELVWTICDDNLCFPHPEGEMVSIKPTSRLSIQMKNNKGRKYSYQQTGVPYFHMKFDKFEKFSLVELLEAGRKGDVAHTKKLLGENKELSSVHRNLVLCAIESAKCDKADVVSYLMETYHLSPDEKVPSWIVSESKEEPRSVVLGVKNSKVIMGAKAEVSSVAADLSIRDAAEMSHSRKVMKLIGPKK